MTALAQYAEWLGVQDNPALYRWLPIEFTDILLCAEQLQAGVEARAKASGTSAYFGEISALAAFHALAVWVCRLPDDERDAVLRWVGGDG